MKDLEKFVLFFGATFLTICGFFFFICASTIIGGIAGWTVGIFFSDPILVILGKFGLRDVTMWQVGIFAGFFGGFLKTKVTVIERKSS